MAKPYLANRLSVMRFVRETRVGPSEALDAVNLLALPQQETIERAILEAEDLDQPTAAKVLIDALFSEEPAESKIHFGCTRAFSARQH